jgi:hypothetical protein
MSKILEKIGKMDDNALARLPGNAQVLMEKSSGNQDAALVINALEDEWSRRLNLFRRGGYKATSPVHGVLSVVGCKVGNEGAAEKQRRLTDRLKNLRVAG